MNISTRAGAVVDTITMDITAITLVIRTGVHTNLYLKGNVTATTLSITMTTMMHLPTFSAEFDNHKMETDLMLHVRYSSGQNNCHQTNGKNADRIAILIISAMARLFRYCRGVLESSLTLERTIKVNMLPRIPQQQMIGQMAQYRTIFSIIMSKKSFSLDVRFSKSVVTFKAKLVVVF